MNSFPVTYGRNRTVFHPASSRNGMVSSVDDTASRVGVDILRKGGNAIDAAVGVGFALAVAYPQAGNLGGGGFMLLTTPEKGVTAIDFRETAPASVRQSMYLNRYGRPDYNKSLTSWIASCVPGTVAGLIYALEMYGTLSLSEVIEPAVRMASDGIRVNSVLAHDLQCYGREVLLSHASSRKIFLSPEGDFWREGDILVQSDLAHSLALIARYGRSAFYRGEISDKIASAMRENGGLVSAEELARYQIKERVPLCGDYRGYQIFSMPPPSSGGLHLIQLLHILENFNLKEAGYGSAFSMHVMAEAEKHVYADRSKYPGDPEYTFIPCDALTSKEYASQIANSIRTERAIPSSQILPGTFQRRESEQTTHFSVADRNGHAVSVTYTLNTNFGNGIVIEGTGILMNNEMDDFALSLSRPNVYGLYGGEANLLAPSHRPLSSMAPTIVMKDGRPWLVTGTPGGSRIITTVLQLLVNTIDFGMNIAEATCASRFHHQWLPDELWVEPGFSPDTLELLRQKGHNIVLSTTMGCAQSIMLTGQGEMLGAADPRIVSGVVSGF